MRTRIITGVITVSLWFLLLYAGLYKPFWGVMVVIGTICSYEFFNMVLKDHEKGLLPLVVPLAVIPVYAIYNPVLEHLVGRHNVKSGVVHRHIAGHVVEK